VKSVVTSSKHQPSVIGACEGEVVGSAVGLNDGVPVGMNDGVFVGINDGNNDGSNDGSIVGRAVGAAQKRFHVYNDIKQEIKDSKISSQTESLPFPINQAFMTLSTSKTRNF